MALNQRYTRFEHIALTADRNILSGAPVRIGQVAGVAQTTANSGEKVTVWLNGSYDLEVTGELTEGQAVYIDANGGLTADGTDADFFGVAVTTKGTGDGVAEVAPAGIITPTAAPEPAGE